MTGGHQSPVRHRERAATHRKPYALSASEAPATVVRAKVSSMDELRALKQAMARCHLLSELYEKSVLSDVVSGGCLFSIIYFSLLWSGVRQWQWCARTTRAISPLPTLPFSFCCKIGQETSMARRALRAHAHCVRCLVYFSLLWSGVRQGQWCARTTRAISPLPTLPFCFCCKIGQEAAGPFGKKGFVLLRETLRGPQLCNFWAIVVSRHALASLAFALDNYCP